MVLFLYLLFIFQYQVGTAFAYLFNIDASTALKVLAFCGSVFSIFEYQKIKKNKIVYNKSVVFFVTLFFAFVGASLLFTFAVRGVSNAFMMSYILSYFSTGFTGAILGMFGYRRIQLEKCCSSIFLFCSFLTIPLIICTIRNSGISLVYQHGLDTQTLSYAASTIIVLLTFSVFNKVEMAKRKILNHISYVLSFILIIANLFIVISGGGRAAFLISAIVFLIYFLRLIRNISLNKIVLIFAVGGFGVLLFLLLNSKIDISSGIRKMEQLFEVASGGDPSANQRFELYKRAYLVSLNRFFIGGGAGSTAYDLGFYSHNILFDFLVDFGIVGLFMLVVFISCVFVKFFAQKNKNNYFRFLYILFLTSLISLLFSKSWLYDTQFWFSASGIAIFVFGKSENSRLNYFKVISIKEGMRF